MRGLGLHEHPDRLDDVGEARCHHAHRRRNLNLVCGLLGRLAVRVAQPRLIRIHGGHVAGARQPGVGHGRDFADLAFDRARVACHRQLHEQKADQCEKHREDTITTKRRHKAIVGAVARELRAEELSLGASLQYFSFA